MVGVNYLSSFVAKSYLRSFDFFGVELSAIEQMLGLSADDVKGTVDGLVSQGLLQLNFRENGADPRVMAIWSEDIETQIAKLYQASSNDVFLFPTADVVEEYINLSDYAGLPFTLQRALGDPEYCFECFDLSVLDFYIDRPEFALRVTEIGGRVLFEPGQSNGQQRNGQRTTLLESFGFCFGEKDSRGVAVFLKHLAALPGEHQEHWQGKLIDEKYALHPDYVDVALGISEPKLSMFDAFIAELVLINQMCRRMGRPALFLKVPESNASRPVDFKVPLRSSFDEFVGFVCALDSLMSENINRDFFLDDVAQAKKKGGPRLLEDWLTERFEPHKLMIQRLANQFKLVRRLRQRIATKTRGSAYNGESYKRQRELLTDSYQALRSLRTVLGRDSNAQSVSIPQPISDGDFLAL